jgi:ABC-2 type transport system ATP-binding protein
MNDLLDVPASECSSGMRKRPAIALAFARPCRIVIPDEPLNRLDPVGAFDVRTMLARFVAEGLAQIIAPHDLTTLCGLCESGIVMASRRLIE